MRHDIGLMLLGGGVTVAIIGLFCCYRGWADRRARRSHAAACAAYDRIAAAYRREASLTTMPAPVEQLMVGGALLFAPRSYPRVRAERRQH
jgi:hypothetical protein